MFKEYLQWLDKDRLNSVYLLKGWHPSFRVQCGHTGNSRTGIAKGILSMVSKKDIF